MLGSELTDGDEIVFVPFLGQVVECASMADAATLRRAAEELASVNLAKLTPAELAAITRRLLPEGHPRAAEVIADRANDLRHLQALPVVDASAGLMPRMSSSDRAVHWRPMIAAST